MIVMGIAIPEAAIQAGNRAIQGNFILDDIRCEVAGVLRSLHYETLQEEFDYGANNKDKVDDRVAARILEKAKKDGKAKHLGGGRWQAVA